MTFWIVDDFVIEEFDHAYVGGNQEHILMKITPSELELIQSDLAIRARHDYDYNWSIRKPIRDKLLKKLSVLSEGSSEEESSEGLK